MALVFGDLNPNYRTERLQDIGRTGEFFLGLSLENKRRQEEKRQAEMQRALEMLQRYPETVDQPEGERLGEQFPELRPILSVVRNRTRNLAAIEGAGESWLSGADRLAEEHKASLGRKAMLAMPSSPFGAPNVAALGSLLQESQVHPDSFIQRAGEALPPSQRAAAALWAEERGLPFPEPQYTTRPDPMRDLPQAQRALRIPGTPEQERAARIGADIEEGAGERLKRDQLAAQDRRAAVAAEISRRGQSIRERQLNLSERQQATKEREGGPSSGSYKETRKLLADTATAQAARLTEQQRAWDAEVKEANGGKAPTGEKKARIEAEVSGRLGPRPEKPPAMLPGHLNRLSRRILDEVATVEEAEAATMAAVDWYVKLTTERGLSPAEAMKVILGEAEEPMAESRHFNLPGSSP